MEVFEVFSPAFGELSGERFKKAKEELKRVTEHNVLSQLDLQIFFHVLADDVDFAVRLEAELVDNQVAVVPTEVVEEHGDEILHWAFDIALAVRCAEIFASCGRGHELSILVGHFPEMAPGTNSISLLVRVAEFPMPSTVSLVYSA